MGGVGLGELCDIICIHIFCLGLFELGNKIQELLFKLKNKKERRKGMRKRRQFSYRPAEWALPMKHPSKKIDLCIRNSRTSNLTLRALS